MIEIYLKYIVRNHGLREQANKAHETWLLYCQLTTEKASEANPGLGDLTTYLKYNLSEFSNYYWSKTTCIYILKMKMGLSD